MSIAVDQNFKMIIMNFYSFSSSTNNINRWRALKYEIYAEDRSSIIFANRLMQDIQKRSKT